MNTFAALLRGINVGGHGTLPMKELRTVLEGLGLQEVMTYLQSGNVVFRSSIDDRQELSRKIRSAINDSHGFTPEVLVLSVADLEAAVAASPFPEAAAEPKTLHCSFLRSKPASPDLEKLASLQSASERFELVGSVFYLHAPDGIGRSKLAAQVEKALGVAATGRNWRSVNAVLAMAREVAATADAE